MRKLLTLCVMPLLLAGAGCATQTVAVSDVRAFKPISFSCRDTEATRKQVVAHNAVLTSLQSGKRVVYKDDCPKAEGKPTS